MFTGAKRCQNCKEATSTAIIVPASSGRWCAMVTHGSASNSPIRVLTSALLARMCMASFTSSIARAKSGSWLGGRMSSMDIKKLARLFLSHRATIRPDFLDEMGHMNVRWYAVIFDDATWTFFDQIGLSIAYFKRENTGMFALQQYIRYLAEVRVGENIAIRTRVMARTAKRLHFMHFMVNETTSVLAATVENVGSHMDMTIRRTSPFPPYLSQRFDEFIAAQGSDDLGVPLLLKP